MTIREATMADVPRLVEMGERFIASSPYAALFHANPVQLAATASKLIASPDGVVLVSERDTTVVAMLGLLVYPHLLSNDRVAGEIMYWVEPSARGAGVRLLRAGERWAAEHGATVLQLVSPTPEVDQFYARCGYVPVERSFQKALPKAVVRVETADPDLAVFDGVLEDPEAYRADALAADYQTHILGGQAFHGIALAPPIVGEWIAAQFPHCRPTLSFFRRSPEGQVEPNDIHDDRSMGDWTALLYLNPDPPEGDGTLFWETPSGRRAADVDDITIWPERPLWRVWQHVRARFNRLVLFPAPWFHSRALVSNYGTGPSARLVQVTFGGV